MPEQPTISIERYVEILEKKLAREKNARQQAETILNEKARELYETNVALLASEELLKESLTEQTNLLVQAQDIAKIGSFKWEMNHERFYGSEIFWKLLKIDEEINAPEFAFRALLKLCDKDSQSALLHLVRMILSVSGKQDAVIYKQEIKCAINGQDRVFMTRLQALYNIEGKPKQLLGVIQDV